MASAQTRLVGAVLVLVGAILLVSALFAPWYSISVSGGGASENTNFYAGLPNSNGTIQYSCSGGIPCPSQTSYQNQHANNTGMLAETGYFLVIAGIVLGLVGAVIGLTSRKNPRRAGPAMALAVIGLILAIAAPAMFAVALPGAIGKDIPNHTGTGPWSSFWGSNSTQLGTSTLTETWGAGMAWYISIGAFVVFLVGAILLSRGRKEAPAPVAAPVPVPGQMPPMSPPGSS